MGANVKQSDPWSLLCHSLREQQDCHVHFFWLRVDLTVPLSVCVSPCVCAKNWRSILSLINIQILQLRGGEQLRKTSTCVIAKGSKKDRLHIVLWWRQLGNPRLRRYVDSIERLEIFSLAWMHAMLMWHAQHELWSRSWPMKSEHLGKPTKETAMKRSLKSTFGSYFIEALLRLMQACAQTCGSGLEFQTSQ